jgi:hypothetical protein
MVRTVSYLHIANCVEIDNGHSRVIVATEFGPRVLHYGLDGGDNILGWHPQAEVKTELGVWKPYGGHRLWMAPENMPLSYAPDNGPVELKIDGDLAATFTAETEPATGIQKQTTVKLEPAGAGVTLEHRITNRSVQEKELALWALTILRPGGEIVVPNEPHAPYGADNLLPVRTITQWSYTDFTDPRWTFGKESVRLKVDENSGEPQKFGVLNKQGWAAYEVEGLRFVKRAQYIEGASYPDMNSNFEAYTAGRFAELETLSPLVNLQPGESASHIETWELSRIT